MSDINWDEVEKKLDVMKRFEPDRIKKLETALRSCINELYRLKGVVGEVDQPIIDAVISDAEKELEGK